MKVLLGAAMAALMFAVPAAAQTAATPAVPASSCTAVAAAPTLPDGATADRAAMEAANTAFMAWAQSSQAALTCRRAEAEALHVQWQALVSEFNAAAEQLNGTNTTWQAEVAEYNERNPTGRTMRRSQGQ